MLPVAGKMSARRSEWPSVRYSLLDESPKREEVALNGREDGLGNVGNLATIGSVRSEVSY